MTNEERITGTVPFRLVLELLRQIHLNFSRTHDVSRVIRDNASFTVIYFLSKTRVNLQL
jgi:hypothetical protein